jgi:hypothetical protein
MQAAYLDASDALRCGMDTIYNFDESYNNSRRSMQATHFDAGWIQSITLMKVIIIVVDRCKRRTSMRETYLDVSDRLRCGRIYNL